MFRYLDKDKFTEYLYRHSRELLDFLQEHHISMDGKLLRATANRGKKKSGVCIVTAWACEQNLQQTLADYGQLRTSLNTPDLLAKALRVGQISMVEYLTELAYLYTADDTNLLAEKEYHQVLAELFKFAL